MKQRLRAQMWRQAQMRLKEQAEELKEREQNTTSASQKRPEPRDPQEADSKNDTRDAARSTTEYPAAGTAPPGTARGEPKPSGHSPQAKPSGQPPGKKQPQPSRKVGGLGDKDKTSGRVKKQPAASTKGNDLGGKDKASDKTAQVKKQPSASTKGNDLGDKDKASEKTAQVKTQPSVSPKNDETEQRNRPTGRPPRDEGPPASPTDTNSEGKAKTATPKTQQSQAAEEDPCKRIVNIHVPPKTADHSVIRAMHASGCRYGAVYDVWLADSQTMAVEYYTHRVAETVTNFIEQEGIELPSGVLIQKASLDKASCPKPKSDFNCRSFNLHTSEDKYTGAGDICGDWDEFVRYIKRHGIKGSVYGDVAKFKAGEMEKPATYHFVSVEDAEKVYKQLAKEFGKRIRVEKLADHLEPYPTETQKSDSRDKKVSPVKERVVGYLATLCLVWLYFNAAERMLKKGGEGNNARVSGDQ